MVPEKTGGTRWLPETNSEALESVYIAQVYLFSRDLSISGFEFEGQRVDNYAKPVGGVWSKKGFCRALPSQVLVRTGISYIGDGIKHGLSETREICSLVEILPEQAVGVVLESTGKLIAQDSISYSIHSMHSNYKHHIVSLF